MREDESTGSRRTLAWESRVGDVVLVVEKDDRVRLGIRQAFKAHQFPLYEVSDPFDAMSALGRASFGAIVVSAGKRQLSLRGLCQLARKRHPGVALFIITSPGVTAGQLEQALGVDGVHVVAAGTTTVDLARQVASVISEPFALPTTQPEGRRPDSDEETRPHQRYPTPAPGDIARPQPGPARTPPLADAPPAAGRPAVAPTPSGATPRPVVAQTPSGATRAPSSLRHPAAPPAPRRRSDTQQRVRAAPERSVPVAAWFHADGQAERYGSAAVVAGQVAAAAAAVAAQRAEASPPRPTSSPSSSPPTSPSPTTSPSTRPRASRSSGPR